MNIETLIFILFWIAGHLFGIWATYKGYALPGIEVTKWDYYFISSVCGFLFAIIPIGFKVLIGFFN